MPFEPDNATKCNMHAMARNITTILSLQQWRKQLYILRCVQRMHALLGMELHEISISVEFIPRLHVKKSSPLEKKKTSSENKRKKNTILKKNDLPC